MAILKSTEQTKKWLQNSLIQWCRNRRNYDSKKKMLGKKESARSKCDNSRVFPEEHENWIWWLGMLEHREGLKTVQVFLVKDEAEVGGGQCSQATQTVITVLQVLVTLVAAWVAWGISHEAAPIQEQLLLWASRRTASLWVAASCKAQQHQQGADSHVSRS